MHEQNCELAVTQPKECHKKWQQLLILVIMARGWTLLGNLMRGGPAGLVPACTGQILIYRHSRLSSKVEEPRRQAALVSGHALRAGDWFAYLGPSILFLTMLRGRPGPTSHQPTVC